MKTIEVTKKLGLKRVTVFVDRISYVMESIDSPGHGAIGIGEILITTEETYDQLLELIKYRRAI